MSVTLAVTLVIVISTVSIIVSITVPLILAAKIERVRRQDLVEDYKRQDRTSERLISAGDLVAGTAKTVNDKLDVIHTLVNSNMTAAMQGELSAVTGQVALMREVIALRRVGGQKPDAGALAALAAAEAKAGELTSRLEDRKTAG